MHPPTEPDPLAHQVEFWHTAVSNLIRRVDPLWLLRDFRSTSVNIWHHILKGKNWSQGNVLLLWEASAWKMIEDGFILTVVSMDYHVGRWADETQNLILLRHCEHITIGDNDWNLGDTRSVDEVFKIIFKMERKSLQICISCCLHHLTIRGSTEAETLQITSIATKAIMT